MKFPQVPFALILGFVINYAIINGMVLDNCDEKLTREDYIELDEVCDECYEEWHRSARQCTRTYTNHHHTIDLTAKTTYIYIG